MAQTEEGQNRASQQHYVSIPMKNISTDLMQRLVSSGNHSFEKFQDQSQEDSEDIELSLGLSLNGRFGVDPRAKNNLSLKRSSSIPDFTTTTTPAGEDPTCRHVSAAAFPSPLVRTCSLPTETEEWRKRKELQTLRRMEAKRKRSEKQRNFKAARDRSRVPVEEDDRRGFNGSRQSQEQQSLKGLDEFSSSMAVPASVSGAGLELNVEKDNGPVGSGGLDGLTAQTQPSFQGSIASNGSGSSGISESNSLTGQGNPVSNHLN